MASKGIFAKGLLAAAALGVLAAPLPAFAGATYHNMPGVACGAFNNNQANLLERNHVRIYNPVSNPNSIWVLCPVQRVVEDLDASTAAPSGWVNAYYATGVSPSAAVSCTVREYWYYTEAFPGANDALNQVTVTATQTVAAPDVVDTYWSFPAESDPISNYHYFTVACLLPPGTGLNSIDFQQQ